MQTVATQPAPTAHEAFRWCSECTQWREVVEHDAGRCWCCESALGETLAVGMVVKMHRRRYAHGEYGPRPIVWLAGRVTEIQSLTRDTVNVRLETARGVTSACMNFRPLSASRAL